MTQDPPALPRLSVSDSLFLSELANQNQDLSDDPQSRNASSEVVQNYDIMSLIFGFLDVDPTGTTLDAGGLASHRQSLLNAALACKYFKEPALDTLWSVLPSFLPLFQLLPSFTLVNGTYILEDIQPTDWEYLDYHARRVRVLFLRGPAPVISRFAYLFIARQRHSPIAPGIRRLHVLSDDPNSLPDALLALNPCLEVVEVHDGALESTDFLHLFLNRLKQDVPKLRRLFLEGNVIVNLQPILWLRNLEQVNLKLYNCYLSPRFIDDLGNLEHLRDAVLHAGSPAPKYVPPLVTRGGALPTPNSQLSSRFRQIRSLHLIGDVCWMKRLVDQMDLRNLKRFVLEEVTSISRKRSSIWMQFFQNISTSESIEEVEIRQCGQRNGGPTIYFAASCLSSLFQYRRLTSLVITGAAFSASDDDIISMLVAFPSLKRLTLPQSSYKISPTMASVLQINLCSSEIEEVEICIGGRAQAAVNLMQRNIDQIPRARNHTLRVLRISSSFDTLQHQDVVEYARFLHRAFPNLVVLEGIGPHALQESWPVVQNLYMILQTELRFFKDQ